MSIDFDSYYRNINQDKRYIFHYTNQYVALEKILFDNKLRFCTRENSHDPFESDSLIHTYNPDENDMNKNIEQMIYTQEVDKVRKSVKCACFCYDRDIINSYPWDKGCFRSRMWSQYANAHQGVCLVFDYNQIVNSVLKELPTNSHTWIITDKVNYDNKNNSLKSIIHIDYNEMSLPPVERLKKYAKAYLFSKLKDYENEQEYRICINDGFNTSHIDVDISNALQGIILGSKFPDVYLPVIEKIAKKAKIPVVKVDWLRGIPFFSNIFIA
jgi:hypothetical protein